MLKQYLDGINQLSDIDVFAAENILQASDQGDRVWPALRHLKSTLTQYMQVLTESDTQALGELSKLIELFLKSPWKSASKVNQLIQVIDESLEQCELKTKTIKELSALIKALAFMARVLPHSLNNLPGAAKWLLPNNWQESIKQMAGKIESKYQLILFFMDNSETSHKLIDKINQERRQIATTLKNQIRKLRQIEKRAKSFQADSQELISEWMRLSEMWKIESEEAFLKAFWKHYIIEENFQRLLLALSLSKEEIKTWKQARENELNQKSSKRKLFRVKQNLNLALIESAFYSVVSEKNKEILGMRGWGGDNEITEIFNSLLQRKPFQSLENQLRGLYDFFLKEVDVELTGSYTIKSKKFEVNHHLIEGKEHDLYQLSLLRHNVYQMRDILEEQYEEVNRQKIFIDRNLTALKKLKRLSEEDSPLKEELLALKEQVFKSYLLLLEEQFILERPNEDNLQFSDELGLIEYYYSSLSIMYLTEIQHLTDLIDNIEQVGDKNFLHMTYTIKSFIKKRHAWAEWLFKFICPAYRACCDQIEQVLKSESLRTVEQLVKINRAIQEGLETIPTHFFFLRSRLKSIFESTGYFSYSLPEEKIKEFGSNYEAISLSIF